MPTLEPWQWALCLLGALITGVAKGGVPGIGIVTVPLFALALPARASVGVVLPVLMCADLVAVATYRRDADVRMILRLTPWVVAGIAAGALLLGKLDDNQIKILMGAILLPLVALALRRRQLTARGIEENPLPAWASGVTGLTAGFTTMVANAAGPVMVLYLLAMRLPKIVFLGTSAWYYFLLNWVKVPFSLYAGTISTASLLQSLVFFPAAIGGALIGRAIARKIDQRAFEAIALAFTALSGVWFLIGGWALQALRGL